MVSSDRETPVSDHVVVVHASARPAAGDLVDAGTRPYEARDSRGRGLESFGVSVRSSQRAKDRFACGASWSSVAHREREQRAVRRVFGAAAVGAAQRTALEGRAIGGERWCEVEVVERAEGHIARRPRGGLSPRRRDPSVGRVVGVHMPRCERERPARKPPASSSRRT